MGKKLDKKLAVIYSSHLSDSQNDEFRNHIELTAGVEKHNLFIHCIKNKKQYSLTQAYNMGWETVKSAGFGDGVIVFCHNDILIRTMDWGKILIGMMSGGRHDIIGVAGTTQMNEHGCWWLTPDGKEMNYGKMVGRVWHTDGVKDWEAVYTETTGGVKDVLVVDGLFFAIKGTTPLKPFDEKFTGFHFYDVSFTFENYLEGYDLGVTDRISIMHKSVGRTNQEWENNRIQFVEMYKDEMPTNVE